VLSGDAADGADPFEWRWLAGKGGEPRPSGNSPARQEADRTAAQDAERGIAEAYEKGRREGEASCREKASAEASAAREQWLHAVQELARYLPGLRRDAEKDVVKLALAIARRIVHRELSVDPGALLGIVKAALDTLEGRELHRVRVHPENVALLRKYLEGRGAGAGIEVLADPGIESRGLIFETAQGSLDASIETQLQEIERGLADLTRRKS
jgi:flagellar assembly protein FliH